MTPRKPGRDFALISLGCPKNLVDSEQMAGLLQLEGHRLVQRPEGADFVLVNTCGFIREARNESLEVIREMLRLKQQGRLGAVVVAGCLTQRDSHSLLRQCPQIDLLLGVFAREEIAAAIDELFAGVLRRPILIRPAPSPPLFDRHRLRLTLRQVAYLKIAEGCDRSCSFCTIPEIRGPYASKPIEEVLAEAQELAAAGVRELILIAQDTSFYGCDLYGRPRLAVLLTRLQAIHGLAWIRLMYLYPMHLSDELIELLASPGKVLPYLDLPLQHINDEILQRMRRRVTRAETERLLDRLRRRIDSLVLRTTLIAGFPGETQQQFDELLGFVRRQRFERLGALAYSPEPGTPAARLHGQVPEQVRLARRDQLLAAQQPIAFDWAASQVGRRIDILIDGPIPAHHDAYLGRSYADAPDIDTTVYVTGAELAPGRIVPCEIVASRGYDLIGAALR